MIYDFSVTSDDAQYRDVEFYCAMADYSDPTWKRVLTFDRDEGKVSAGCWEYDDGSSAAFSEFVGTPPLWIVNLFNTLTPQMEHLARTGKKLVLQCHEELEPEAA